MNYNEDSHIRSVEDVKSFFCYLVNERKINFHPDDSFEGYISVDGHEPSLTNEDAKLFDRLMDESFSACENSEIDIYSLAMDELKSWVNNNRINASIHGAKSIKSSNKEIIKAMDQHKKDILNEQVSKIDEILMTLKQNFDIEKDIPEEYSFLEIVKSNLSALANNESKIKNEDYIGKTIKIIKMNGEESYNGKFGVVDHIDDMGLLHGTWGGLAVNPYDDLFVLL